jgi:D-alanyl-D-alanine carboxypeptidase
MTTRRTMLKTGAAGLLALTTNTAMARHAELSTVYSDGELQAALDDIAATAASGVLAEVHDAGRVWRGSSGTAQLGTSQPVPANGRFRIGSITKTFVATVALQLVGERRIALTDPVERWLPGVIPGGDRVTVHHLLQHTSGVVNYTNTAQFRALYGGVEAVVSMRERTWTPPELLAFIAGLPSLFEPGTSWMYSNTDYILLGLVVEQATGNHYSTEVARRILCPLGLRDTQVPGANPSIAGPHSHGYLPLVQNGTVVPVDITLFNPSVSGAAGEILSTAADLNRFYRALMTGRLLRPAQLAQMRTAWPTGRSYDYGLGLQTRQLADGTRLWGHEGDIFGYQAASWTTEDGDRQLTVAVNPWGTGDLRSLIENLLTTAFRQP